MDSASPSDLLQFNDDRDLTVAHRLEAMDCVLHIYDRHWHGIRSATACLPGGKLAISHKKALLGEEIRHIQGLIFRHGFTKICYQGYSECADALVDILARDLGGQVEQYVVTHVTTSQFENHFEMHMLRRMVERLRAGQLRKLGSVKPNFGKFLPEAWQSCLVNLPPNVSSMVLARPERDVGVILLPLENTWRKNLYTNVIAAHGSPLARELLIVNFPTLLDTVIPLPKLRSIPYQSLRGLLSYMSMSGLVLNATFAECQPMTQLEALAVGTPCITGPLRLPGFEKHPLTALCEVTELDDPGLLRERINAVLGAWRADPAGVSAMTDDYLQRRTAAGFDSYREFLEL